MSSCIYRCSYGLQNRNLSGWVARHTVCQI